MAEFIRIKGWSKYQHYKDRNPPWIKLHRELLTSLTWAMADDASRVLAVACMLLAAATDNKIPFDAGYVKRVAYLNADPDFTQLLKLEFLEVIDDKGQVVITAITPLADASKMQAHARPETETETEQRKRQREMKRKSYSPHKPAEVLPVDSWHSRIKAMVQSAWSEHNGGIECPWGAADGAQLKMVRDRSPGWHDGQYAQCLANLYASVGFPRSKLPFEFLPRLCSFLSGPRNEFNQEKGNGNGNYQSTAAKRDAANVEALVRSGLGARVQHVHADPGTAVQDRADDPDRKSKTAVPGN